MIYILALLKYNLLMDKNWISLVERYDSLINTKWIDESDGVEYIFDGLLHASDDYYYMMRNIATGKTLWISCCGVLESCLKKKT